MGNELSGGRVFLVVGGRVGLLMTGYSFGGRGAREPCVDQARSFISWCDRLHNISPVFFVEEKKVCWVGGGWEIIARWEVRV